MKNFIPFTLLLLLGVAAPKGTCPPSGMPKPGGDTLTTSEKQLNVRKNRKVQPAARDIDVAVTYNKLYGSKDDSTLFSQDKGAKITGFIQDARDEQGESCNCHATHQDSLDIHVYLAPSAAIAQGSDITRCLVIEITPYVKKLHPTWTSEYIKSLKGKQVTVSGWLLFDYLHRENSASSPNHKELERYTVWEIHPWTDLAVN